MQITGRLAQFAHIKRNARSRENARVAAINDSSRLLGALFLFLLAHYTATLRPIYFVSTKDRRDVRRFESLFCPEVRARARANETSRMHLRGKKMRAVVALRFDFSLKKMFC